ncbi:MAG: hypothetical protein F4246_08435 [Rhodothermaceae bacterium]|nr:hypothetical protein [Rhodothermaceae bacterium]MXX58629.1 hypothetical protein [Rhodothermaceae bacterium]MYD19708.1 hypothetical protein [Rhodothermaceae bacterium]MYD57027.1 hypothetical protein [Rhodothermaceae bacterium]MYI44756.1 hypothetical protein [Rhodothermaceae bacterium]
MESKSSRGVRGVASKVVKAGNQVKQGAQVTADKALEAGNQVKRGVEVATEKMVDAGSGAKHGVLAAADKTVGVGQDVKRKAQVAADKVINTGSRAAGGAQDTLVKVADSSKEKLLDAKSFAGEQWERFTTEVENASNRYTNMVTETLVLTNKKLEESVNTVDSEGTIRNRAKKAAVAAGAATASAYSLILAASPAFGELLLALKVKFAAAGLRDSWRLMPVAESFYESSVPQVIRNFGKDAVVEFLDGKHASHIKSVYNHPELAIENGNIVWEAAWKNLSRGSKDMTGVELAKANAANIIDAAGIVAGQTLQIAAKAGCIGMALEGVVSLGENMIYVYAGERTAKEAVIDVSKNMAQKGMLSAVGGVVVSVAIAYGAGPALASMAPVLVTIGGTVYLLGAVNRIAGAYQRVNSGEVIAAET